MTQIARRARLMNRAVRRLTLECEGLETRALLALPSGLEQELFEWANRLRTNPSGEYDRLIKSEVPLSSDIPGVAAALAYFNVNLALLESELGALTPVPPLAWSTTLHAAALGHNMAMIANDQQSHQLPGEGNLGSRANAAGYTGWSTLGENVYAYATSPAQGHAGFVIDWGFGADGMQDGRGHRVSLMSPAFREAGFALTLESNPMTSVGPQVITQNFGARPAQTMPFLVGVAYADQNGNAFYNNGEGLGGITVTAVGPGGTFTTTTWASGGYQLALPPGAYSVTFSGGGLDAARTSSINVGAQNVKLDLNTLAEHAPAGVVRFASTTANVVEGQWVDLTLIRSGETSEAAYVDLVVASGTTVTGDDVEPLPNAGRIHFEPGQALATVRLTTIDDSIIEGVEVLVLAIQPGPGVAIATNSRVTVLIADNDRPPVEPVTAVSARLVNSPGGGRTVTVQLSGDLAPGLLLRPRSFVARRAGVDRLFDTADDRVLRVTRVTLNRRTKVATITLSAALRRGEPLILTILAGTLVDSAGGSNTEGVSFVVPPLVARVRARR